MESNPQNELDFVEETLEYDKDIMSDAAPFLEPIQNEDEPIATQEVVPTLLNPWTIEFYQQFFNVTQKQVMERALYTCTGPFRFDFFKLMRLQPDHNWSELDLNQCNTHQSNADLWGPFWITCAAAVSMIIGSGASNLLNYLSLQKTSIAWAHDFTTITTGMGIFYAYASLSALLLWAATKFLEVKSTLLEFVCLYGYSYTLHIPIYLICIIFSRYDILQWMLVLLAWVWTGLFIASNIGMMLHRQLRLGFRFYIIPIAILTLVVHIFMGFFVKLYFLTFFSSNFV